MAKAVAARGDPEVARRAGSRASTASADPPSAPAVLAALDAIPAPAVIIGRRGDTVCSKAAGHSFVRGGPDAPRLSASVDSAPGIGAAERAATPIGGTGPSAWSLALLPSASAAAGAPPLRWNLTGRQREILELLLRGMTNASIAEDLGISLKTVEFHVSAIFDKAGVESRTALIASLIRLKYLYQGEAARAAETLSVTPADRQTLDAWSISPGASPALALRARIVLASGDGEGVRAIARRLGTTVPTVCAWRTRYRTEGIAGLRSRKGPGRPKELPSAREQQIVDLTLDARARGARWSAARLARATGVSESTVRRIWYKHGLRAHRPTRSPTPEDERPRSA